MQVKKYLLVTALVVALLPATLAAQERKPEVVVKVTTDGVTFEPTVANNGLSISIAGGKGCVDFSKRFEGGVRLTLDDLAPKGSRVPDGIYNYRTSVDPKTAVTVLDRNVGRGDREIKEYLKRGHKLVNSWDELPNGEPVVAQIIEGSFGVLEGRIVDPRVVEEEDQGKR